MSVARIFCMTAGLLASNYAVADTTLSAGVGYDWLNNNFSNWQHSYVRGQHLLNNDLRLRAEVRRYERYNLSNTTLSGGVTYQVMPRTIADLEVATTPSADFRPDNQITAQVYQGLWPSGGVSVGARHSSWPTNNSRTFFIEPDYYYGPLRFAARLNWIDLDQVGDSSGYTLSAAWYYTDRSHTTLAYSDGREIEPIGDQVIISQVTTLALFGRHYVTRAWSLEYALSWTQQGDFYDRTGAEIGIHYRF